MIVSSIQAHYPTTPEWQRQWSSLEQTDKLPALVWSALHLGLLFSRWVLSTALTERAQAPQTWPVCEQCGHRHRSKGFRTRQVKTLIGVVR
ncbi:MAG: hypothetical protein AAF703_17855 [Cyanobacteria bacterium P01_D01_bin.105]